MYSDSADEEAQHQDFGELLDSFYEFDQPEHGDIREAEILLIDPNQIVVDMGVKRDGIVPLTDLERLDPAVLKSLRVGDHVPVYILSPNDLDGNLLVSLNLGLQGQDWESARKLMESGDLVEAEITGYNKGGLLVRFGRLEGFVPVSHCVDIPQGLPQQDRREAMEAMIGQTIGLKVIEVNQRRRRLILSQREAQREWRSNQKQRLLDELKVGDVVHGRVTGIRDFGVFVDIGGADGLIHVSELAWHRVPHPADVVSIGEEIDVCVLELNHEQERIALSLRRTRPDPWDIVLEKYEVGQIVEGTVGNVVDFGAFVVLDDGVEGLLHITEMDEGTLSEPHSYVQRGDRVTMKIVRIEPDRKRIGFTQRGLGLEHPGQLSGDTSPAVDEADEPAPPEAASDEPAPSDEAATPDVPTPTDEAATPDAPAPTDEAAAPAEDDLPGEEAAPPGENIAPGGEA